MKRKGVILSVFIALIISLSTLAFFGCENKTNAVKTYNLFNDTLNLIKGEDTFTKEQGDEPALGYKTNFDLALFAQKSSAGNLDYDSYKFYRVLIANGMNFIDNYYHYLSDNSKVEMDYTNMNQKINYLKGSYNKLKAENVKIKNCNKNESKNIYNGYFYNYKNAAADFINNVYSTANALGGYIANTIKVVSKIGTEKMTKEDFKFYIDYNLLQLSGDYKILYMSSGKGHDLKEEYSRQGYLTYIENIGKMLGGAIKEDKVVAAEGTAFKKMIGTIKNTRDDALMAIKDFSLYDYCFKYEKDLAAYTKDNEKATMYYNFILDYFGYSNATGVQTYSKEILDYICSFLEVNL